jgi:acyl-CoA thioester hydrolase
VSAHGGHRGAALVPVHRGCVNSWECDENEHLNMRHYLAKANEGLPFLLREIGLGPAALASMDARPRILAQHVRYLQEARAGEPLTIVAGVAEASAERLVSYAEVRHSGSGEVLATLLTRVALAARRDGAPREIPGAAAMPRCEVPPHGAPRGIPASEPPVVLDRAALAPAGFVEIGRGTVRPQECDAHGELEVHEVAGRISDGVVNLWVHHRSPEELRRLFDGTEGGALLELRMVHHAPLRIGTPFTIHSGYRAVTRKVVRVVHLVYDEASGACAASCDGVAISMDLRSRRAIELSEARRAGIEAMLLRLPS